MTTNVSASRAAAVTLRARRIRVGELILALPMPSARPNPARIAN
jgi:hypothetical protein